MNLAHESDGETPTTLGPLKSYLVLHRGIRIAAATMFDLKLSIGSGPSRKQSQSVADGGLSNELARNSKQNGPKSMGLIIGSKPNGLIGRLTVVMMFHCLVIASLLLAQSLYNAVIVRVRVSLNR